MPRNPAIHSPSHFNFRKILVLRGGALGDFIVTLPALALLRRRWRDARIELVGNATAAALGRTRGLLDAVHSQHEARWAALYDPARLPAELGAWVDGFDLVVNYWPDPDGELRRRFPTRAGQVFLHADALPALAPAAAHYCAPLRELGLETHDFLFPLPPVATNVSEWNSTGNPLAQARSPDERNFIAVHPGSGSAKKNWPADRWRALIDELPAPVSVILGEAENALAAAFGAGNPSRVQLLINRPLEELVSHFHHCRLFLGHDSGITHLAAACGVPCVVLFGPTAPTVWAPPAATVRVIQCGPELAAIALADVRREVAAALRDRT